MSEIIEKLKLNFEPATTSILLTSEDTDEHPQCALSFGPPGQYAKFKYGCDIDVTGDFQEEIARRLAHSWNMHSELVDLLITVLPYVEGAEWDEAYKAGAVAKIAKQMRDTIAKAEARP